MSNPSSPTPAPAPLLPGATSGSVSTGTVDTSPPTRTPTTSPGPQPRLMESSVPASASVPTTADESCNEKEFDQDPSVIGFPPPIEERPGPEGAEGDEVDMAPATYVKSSSTSVAAAGPTEVAAAPVIKAGEPLIKSERGDHDTEGESHDEEQYDSVPATITSSTLLPWGAPKERSRLPGALNIDPDIRPGEFVMRTLFAEFTQAVDKKVAAVMADPLEKPLAKSLQRGEDAHFDQILSAFGTVAEHCLPSIMKTLFSWYERQGVEWTISDYTKGKGDSKGKSDLMGVRSELEWLSEKRDLAIEFIFSLVLIEVLKQLHVHPGHEDLVHYIEDVAFRHFKYRDTATLGPNAANIHQIADLYAEVLGVLAQSRFLSIKRKFFSELREYRMREPSTHTTQSIISLLMGMKFFRVKMVPFEDFEHSFQFMQECAQFFLEVKDKDVKHSVAGLFVEILVPVAAAVKNEVNVPCLKNFVEKLYSQTLDMCTKTKHRLAIFPLVTCLLCVSQKAFFLHNWHYFLTMCLQQLKNKDGKMARVALESLYRLLWVYMIRIKCESNNVTQSRLQSIVNSLFPKGSKAVVPRDAPLNIFVKIIQFIAQEKLDFAMREIVFDLLSVGRPIKVVNAPERMSIGLRAFLVVADSLQQKEGDPPMPRTVAVMPSGSTLRVKKTFLSKMLTDETAKNIGISSYYPYVRKVFDDIIRALDSQFGRPFLLTNAQTASKELDEAKPKLDLFRTVIAAIPRLIPDGMSRGELVDTLARLTVHTDEELRQLAYQSLQNLINDFPDWREDVLYGFMQFVVKDIADGQTALLDNALRMVSQLLTAWKNAAGDIKAVTKSNLMNVDPTLSREHQRPDLATTLHMAEGFALVMLCHCRLTTRRIALMILKEVKNLFNVLGSLREECTVLDALDRAAATVLDECSPLIPQSDKIAALNTKAALDFQWITDRSSYHWTSGFNEEGVARTASSSSTSSAAGTSSASPSTYQNTVNLYTADPWSACIKAVLQPDRLLAQCPTAVYQAWPTVHTRLTQLFTVVDPAPMMDNRASLLRPGTAPKKTLNEKDISMHLWKNYIMFAARVVPAVPSPVVRCVSPDLLLSSSPESLGVERNSDSKSPSPMVSPTVLYKLLVPLLRCEVADMRDSVVLALGTINHVAIMDLMSELVNCIREAIDRKQENMRRRRRRDALRLQLVRVFDMAARQGTFARAAAVTDVESGCLASTFTDYIDGARLYLETESDKEIVPSVREIKSYFSSFVKSLIGSFDLERRRSLLKRDLRRHLFYLFSSWSGRYGAPFDKLSVGGALAANVAASTAATSAVSSSTAAGAAASTLGSGGTGEAEKPTAISDFEFSALQAMIAVLCCGPLFDEKALVEEGGIFNFLDLLLSSRDKKVYSIAEETIVLLLEFNPESTGLLEWVVERCFTGENQVADGCFMSLATIFATRLEYPCDHYTAIINVTLMNTGCPRSSIHETALQLLQILDKRFFGSSPAAFAATEDATASSNTEGTPGKGSGGIHAVSEIRAETAVVGTLDVLLSTTYSRSQLYLSRQLAQLHPELTMPMFSEICSRLQTARPAVIKCLLYYLVPWLFNMELVDANLGVVVSETAVASDAEKHSWGVDKAGAAPATAAASEKGNTGGGREGWGTAEATEMIMNNLFYITVKFGDELSNEVEHLWGSLCECWPKNVRIIIRYLFIVSGMAPNELVEYAKRVVLYLGRAQPDKTLDVMMLELQTVEALNCTIERTETPPYFRLTSLRKASSNSESNMLLTSSRQDLNALGNDGTMKGTIHTKRHSQQDTSDHQRESHSRSELNIVTGGLKSAGNIASSAGSAMVAGIQRVGEKVRALSGSASNFRPNFGQHHVHAASASASEAVAVVGMSQSLVIPTTDDHAAAIMSHSVVAAPGEVLDCQHYYLAQAGENSDMKESTSVHRRLYQPHPLPMPEYGGWFAPLTEFLPSPSVPIATFHRCNLAVVLLTDLVVDCHSVDWSAHIPLIMHITFLGLDNARELVYRHCRQMLLNLMIVLGDHGDHLTVSSILMNSKTDAREFGLSLPPLPNVLIRNFTELGDGENEEDEWDCAAAVDDEEGSMGDGGDDDNQDASPSIVTTDDKGRMQLQSLSAAVVRRQRVTGSVASSVKEPSVAELTKALIHFIASKKCQPFWQYEDITRTDWTIRSADQIDVFLQHVVSVFAHSLPHAHLDKRWAQLALQLALSCSSRHYAGRSLQIFRALRVPISSRMLSDILSRLVETIAEQGEDMQGYVTELILTLEAVIECLDSDIRSMRGDIFGGGRDIFKSTPNLMKEAAVGSAGGDGGVEHGAGGPGTDACVSQTAVSTPGSSAASERHQAASPVGHGYHVSAPPAGTPGPFPTRYYDRSVSNNFVEIRGRSSTATNYTTASRHSPRTSSALATSSASCNTLSRSRSAQSLKMQAEAAAAAAAAEGCQDKMNILVQLFWICLVVLESDYEHEFLLGLRLLEKVLSKLPLDRPDVREKIEKLQSQLKWPNFPGVHSLLLKGCTNPATYESTIRILSHMTLLLDFAVVDPSQSLAFPMNVIALLPYMVQNYEDANELCIETAENIAAVSAEKTKKLENLATVMTLYSRRTFSKESFQWTKCVVKYLHDLYSHYSFNMLGFLVEVLEKGSPIIQGSVLTIIHCLLHYVDMSQATQTINADLLRTVAKFVESQHWKEALKILKLAVTRSSTLVAPSSAGSAASSAAPSISYHWESASSGLAMSVSSVGGLAIPGSVGGSVPAVSSGGPNFAEADLYFSKKELPGRTMEFTFDVGQTPIIGRRQQPVRPTFHGFGTTSTTGGSTLSGISSFMAAAAAASSSSSASVSAATSQHGGHSVSSVSAASAASSASTALAAGSVSSVTLSAAGAVSEGDDRDSIVISGSTAVRRSKAAAAAAALQYSNANRVTVQRSGTTASAATIAECGDQSGGNAQCLSPKRSHSLSAADSASSGWKRPWMSQAIVRERLVNLLNSCGQRVGLPKSPSVIFSQTSELLERQSSMASSTEEVSGGNMDVSTAESSRHHDTTDTEQRFGIYMREFDFLDCELESLEGESVDNFNWGVRRPSLSHLDGSIGGGSYQDLLGSSASIGSGGVGLVNAEGGSSHGGASSHYASGSSTQHSAEITPVLPKRETRGAPRRGAESGGSIGIEGGRRRSGGGHDRGSSDIGGSGGGGATVDHRHRHHRRALREARRGIGWEESSDDEAISQASVRSDNSGASSSVSTTSSVEFFGPIVDRGNVVPPDGIAQVGGGDLSGGPSGTGSAPANVSSSGSGGAKKRRRHPTPPSETESMSDTSDDMSDHDLTPCNMSPSLSQLMTWNMGGASASVVRPGSSGLLLSHETDEFEGLWKEHVHIIVQNVKDEENIVHGSDKLLQTFDVFGKLFMELRLKTCLLTQDAVMSLAKDSSCTKSGQQQGLLKAVSENLQELTDIVSEVACFPYVWCDFQLVGGERLVERVKFCILEIQENLENFADKKEMTIGCLDAVKMHQKLVTLGDMVEDYPNIDSEQVDLCRCLYKLHFQLLLLLECYGKLLRLLESHVKRAEGVEDKSAEVTEIRNELLKAEEVTVEAAQIDIANVQEGLSPSRDPSEAAATEPAATSSPLRSAPSATKRDLENEEEEEEEEEELPSDVDQEDPAAAAGKPKPASALSESEDACSLNSSDMSAVETIAFDAQSARESEYHVFGLICESKYSAAMTYFRQKHRVRWMTCPTPSEDDDVKAAVDIYCRLVAERGENIFVLTTLEVTMSDHCSRLMDASLALLSTVRAMEMQLARQKQTPPLQQEQPQNAQSAESPTTPTAGAEAILPAVNEETAEAAAEKGAPSGATLKKSSSDHTVASGLDNAGEESSL